MVLKQTKTFAELVKFEHSIFALPFAYTGSFLAAGGFPGFWKFAWITIAMVGARSAAMGFNRLIDRVIDAKNPRTADRHLPRGLISPRQVLIFSLAGFGALGMAIWQLSPRHMIYLPLLVFILICYSYTKRFTPYCHLVLGLAIAFAPLGGWIAVRQQSSLAALLLSATVGSWVAGFDIIYAIQDIDFDRSYGVHSIPADYGINAALWWSRGLHSLSVLFLVMIYKLLPLGFLYLVGIIMAAGLLCYEHLLISPRDFSRINVAFFNVNGLISMIVFVFTLLDLLS
ncbi:UbiA-like polyprenyltransferase [Zhaonella formicivorans]|jgi:4-hydroxybenzoate polyprenyltransferase|uniref:UbiA-like polyprenyltransferase n=1 Tax=Zhaonella formicivorans TaxID=2528593 RepID=UPI001D0FBF85|nr:UbiA-like polyprenyltransferase [Zhaonella formicivorans]